MKSDAKHDAILLIDKDEQLLKRFSRILSREFKVYTARDRVEATTLLLGHINEISLALIDLHPDNCSGEGYGAGADMAAWCAELNPRLGLIAIGHYSDLINAQTIHVDDYLIKDVDLPLLVARIKHTISKKRASAQMRRRQFTLLNNLPGKAAIAFKARDIFSEAKGGKVEGVHAICTQDGQPIKFVVYVLPEQDKNMVTIGAVSTIGCGRNCAFCLSGQRAFVRPLTTNELLGQFHLGLDSLEARKVFLKRGRIKLFFHFTGEGDLMVDNMANGAEAIRQLATVPRVITRFIITSIGQNRALENYLENYMDLPRVRHYWSANFADEELREELMPYTKGQSITRLMPYYREIARRSGNRVTLSIILIKGLNDTPQEAKRISQFCQGNDWLTVKVQNLVGDALSGQTIGSFFGQSRYFQDKVAAIIKTDSADCLKPKQNDLVRFGQYLKYLGVPYRLRWVIGPNILSSCGTTIPERRQKWRERNRFKP